MSGTFGVPDIGRLKREPFSYRTGQRKYREQELQTLFGLPAFTAALAAAEVDTAAGKDAGSCVLGAGVCIDVIPQYGRNARRFTLLSAPFQGNVGSATALARAALILKDAGIDCYWHDGVMD